MVFSAGPNLLRSAEKSLIEFSDLWVSPKAPTVAQIRDSTYILKVCFSCKTKTAVISQLYSDETKQDF